MKTRYLIGIPLTLIALRIILQYKPKRGLSPKPTNKDSPMTTKHHYATFPGWRRAKQSEVAPEMTKAAVSALSQPIGTYVDHEGFRVALETHHNEAKGYHKGSSIFLPA